MSSQKGEAVCVLRRVSEHGRSAQGSYFRTPFAAALFPVQGASSERRRCGRLLTSARLRKQGAAFSCLDQALGAAAAQRLASSAKHLHQNCLSQTSSAAFAALLTRSEETHQRNRNPDEPRLLVWLMGLATGNLASLALG